MTLASIILQSVFIASRTSVLKHHALMSSVVKQGLSAPLCYIGGHEGVIMHPRQLASMIATLLCVFLWHTFLSASANAAPTWIDGVPQQSMTTNCSVIGNSYQEPGTSSYVGYWGEPNLSTPWVNAVYYLHLHIVQLGFPCGTVGSRSSVELFLPANTSLAMSPINPVNCFWKRGGGIG